MGWTYWLISSEKNIAEMKRYHFLYQVIERLVALVFSISRSVLDYLFRWNPAGMLLGSPAERSISLHLKADLRHSKNHESKLACKSYLSWNMRWLQSQLSPWLLQSLKSLELRQKNPANLALDPQRLWNDKCFLFPTTKFWSNLLGSNKLLIQILGPEWKTAITKT